MRGVVVLVPGYGWWGLDPTNQKVVGEQHVKIGHGRGAILVVPFMDDPGEAFSNSDEERSLSDDIRDEP